jgi:tripartite-type tricarboxylate transporter receptor subunit TctC
MAEGKAMIRRILRVVAACLALGAGPAAAQTYPDRIIKLVVPFPAGGPVDVMARLLGQQLSVTLGQTIVIDNRPGAGGTLGAKSVAGAEPDGYTLLFGTGGSLGISPLIYKSAGYDPVKSFAAVAMVSNSPNVLAVRPEVPAQGVKELVAYAKANPGKLSYGAVVGTPPHLMTELFKAETGSDIFFVPYKGAAQALTELLAGQTQVTLLATVVLLTPVQEGKLRALAVTSAARLAELPGVPTMKESGFADFPPGSWQAVVAPAGTPAAIVARLNGAINESLRAPELKAGFARLRAEANIGSPQDLSDMIASENRKWSAVVKSLGLKVD